MCRIRNLIPLLYSALTPLSRYPLHHYRVATMPPLTHLLPLLLLTNSLAQAFYLPALSPTVYHDDQKVPLYVNKIFSDTTQLPYAYGDLRFVCQPTGEVHRTWLNLGEVLRGDRIISSDYEVGRKRLHVQWGFGG
ncbi:hypothetical protein BC936DRAFT_139642 [Jimgerdemannia flammicorona]|uniref:Transmembrane 9 superfamily member n=1 Tax=Jimgerdemannia flammicorona TaxID=994334 RepID=A0A433DHK2_9FUNG|nr:hypothetical protein BC936DRAFT_139642 [Jimgerdemannia flammicorona]